MSIVLKNSNFNDKTAEWKSRNSVLVVLKMDKDFVRYDVRQDALRVRSLPFKHLVSQLEMLLDYVVVESACSNVFLDIKRTLHVKFVALRPTSTVLVCLQLGLH